MTTDTELSIKLMACLSVRDDPVSISKAIDLILSAYPSADEWPE